MPDKDSPLWPILNTLVVSLVAITAVSVGHKDGWITRADLPVVLSIAASALGMGGLRHFFGRKNNNK